MEYVEIATPRFVRMTKNTKFHKAVHFAVIRGYNYQEVRIQKQV